MAERKYNLTPEIVAAFMRFNRMAESHIVGETETSFLVKNKNKMSPVTKNHVESWALSKGFIKGMGYDAMSDDKKAIAQGNMSRNSMHIKEKEARLAANKEENLQAYYNQLPETRRSRAQHKQDMDNINGSTGPVEGVDYRGGKSYNGKKGTNQ